MNLSRRSLFAKTTKLEIDMTTLWLDLETYCETPITHGTYRYAEGAEVLLVAYAFDDEPVEVLDLTEGGSLDNVQMLIDSADRVVIHNSNFDRTVLRCNNVHIPLSKLEDTMAQALAHSLPASLGALCDVLDVPQDKAKDKAGKKLIHLFTKPRPRNVKLRRATRETHPQEWAAFIEYARLDVDAMRDVSRRLPGWNNSRGERRVWELDQHINDRGIAVDVRLAEAALRAFQRSARHLAERAGLLTNGAVPSLTQGARFKAYLAANGYDAEDLTKGSVSAALKGELTDHVRELLEIRQQASATSPAKYKVLINGTSSDGRLRGTMQFRGAGRTGREAHRMFQPGNLPRPTLSHELVEYAIDRLKAITRWTLQTQLAGAMPTLPAENSALRNALIPIVTGFPAAFIGAFFTGSLLIETQFSLDGLGLLSYESVIRRDYPVVMGTLYLFTLIGLVTKLISDLCYVWVDPRVRFD